MMLHSNKNSIGLSIDILEDETRLINYVCLKINGKNLTITQKKKNLTAIHELVNLFDTDTFVYLTINGKGIINKKINKNQIQLDTSQDKLINLVLANANSADFYAQKYLTTNDFFVTIARKSLVDNLLSELESIACNPIKLILGPFDIKYVLKLIDTQKLLTNTYQLGIDEQVISDIQKLSTPESMDYTIEGEVINSSELLALSAAISGYLGTNDFSNEFEIIKENRNTITFRFEFKKRMMSALLVVFAILLINFLAYEFLFEKLETSKRLNSDVAKNQMEILKYEEEFKQKKQFIVQKNWNSRYSISEIVEHLASSAPEGLRVIEINYQPENKKKANAAALLNYQYKKIIVLGNVTGSNQLNNWMKALVDSNYFADVSLLNYQLNSSGIGNDFNLEILLK
jgi:hypothetical protein